MLGRGGLSMFSQRGATSGGKPAYTGPVATGTYFPTASYSGGATVVGVEGYTDYYTTEALTSFNLVFANAVANTAVGSVVTEHTTTSVALNLTCVIEYPAGVYTRVKKAGVNIMTLAIGEMFVTDAITLAVPANTKITAITYWEKQGGGQVFVPTTFDVGGSIYVSQFTSNDRTGTVSQYNVAKNWTAADHRIGPCAILSTTTKRTFALKGDSRTEGVQDGCTATNKCCTGEIARAIYNAGYGMLNLGIGNDRVDQYTTSHTLREQLASYCSEQVLGWGINDVFFTTPATIKANTLTVIGYQPSKKHYVYTLPPQGVASTDNFATLVNQTVGSQQTNRLALNALLRAGYAGTVRTWEVADALESSRDSGKWRVDLGLVNGPAPGGDATHENALGNSTIASSGAINLA